MSLKSDIDKSTKKDRLRRRIIQLRRRDRAFAFAGLAVMAGAFIVLLALLGQLVYDGMGRISWQFFASYPSRFASQAGILSAWIGTVLVMLLTALTAVPLAATIQIFVQELTKARREKVAEAKVAGEAGQGTAPAGGVT